MPIYVSLVNFTHEGLRTMKSKGVERSDMVKRNVESLGGKLVHAYYCLGEYDVVAIFDFPSTRAGMKAALLNASMGHIRIKTMPAVSREEWKTVLKETWGKSKEEKAVISAHSEDCLDLRRVLPLLGPSLQRRGGKALPVKVTWASSDFVLSFWLVLRTVSLRPRG